MTIRGTLKVSHIPICSMYGIFTNIYPINDPNVGKYTIHGAYGILVHRFADSSHLHLQPFPRHAGLKVAVLKVLSAADVQNEAATAITQEIIHLRPSETTE